MLREICIDLEIRAYDIGIFSASYNDGGILRIGEDDILMFYGFTVYEGISAVEWFACDNLPSAENPNAFNAVQQCWPELDALWDTLNTATDPAAREAAADAIQAFMAEEAFWIGLWNRPQIAVYRAELQNVRPAGQAQYWQVSAWTRAE
jgi:ABC-type transport system substrate-binding protein